MIGMHSGKKKKYLLKNYSHSLFLKIEEGMSLKIRDDSTVGQKCL